MTGQVESSRVSNDDACERLARCYTGVVSDVMRGMGLADYVLRRVVALSRAPAVHARGTG